MSEKFIRYQTVSGVVLALRPPDVAAITIAGISIYGLDRLIAPKPDLEHATEKPEHMPEEMWQYLKATGQVKERDVTQDAEQLQNVIDNMRRLVIWMVAGIYDDDGNFHPGQVTLSPVSSFDIDARTLHEEDLKHIWNLALSVGREEVGNVEALQSFLGVVRQIGALLAGDHAEAVAVGDYADSRPVLGG